jgi:RNA polymerase sigma-70 factor, ECF subfamily
VATNERALVHLARQGDREAYWRLVQPLLHGLLSAARAILGNPRDAEEVAQECVLKALGNLRGFREEARFSIWLIEITINEARARLRKRPRSSYRSSDPVHTRNRNEYLPKDFTPWREIPCEALERKQLRDALWRALGSLPQEYREVLTLREIAHLSNNETAQVLGLTLRKVKGRLVTARLQMRDALAPGLDGAWRKSKTDHQLQGKEPQSETEAIFPEVTAQRGRAHKDM